MKEAIVLCLMEVIPVNLTILCITAVLEPKALPTWRWKNGARMSLLSNLIMALFFGTLSVLMAFQLPSVLYPALLFPLAIGGVISSEIDRRRGAKRGRS